MFTLLQFKIIQGIDDKPARANFEIYFKNRIERDEFIDKRVPKDPLYLDVPGKELLKKTVLFKIEVHPDDPKMACVRNIPLEGSPNKAFINPEVQTLIKKKIQELFPADWDYSKPPNLVTQCPSSADSPLAQSVPYLKGFSSDESLGTLVDHHQGRIKKLFELRTLSNQAKNTPSGANSRKISQSYSKEEFDGVVHGYLNFGQHWFFLLLLSLRSLGKMAMRAFLEPSRHPCMFSFLIGVGIGLGRWYFYALKGGAAFMQGFFLGSIAFSALSLRYFYYDRVRVQVRMGAVKMSPSQEQAFSEGRDASLAWLPYLNSFKKKNNWKYFNYFGAGMVEQERDDKRLRVIYRRQ